MPLPLAAAHVPSPRQNVLDDALVPEFKLFTDKLPVTPVLSGNRVALVKSNDVGVPKIGVTRVGELEPTKLPLPVTPLNPSPTPLTVVIDKFPYYSVQPNAYQVVEDESYINCIPFALPVPKPGAVNEPEYEFHRDWPELACIVSVLIL